MSAATDGNGPASRVADRLMMELQPVLAALALLTNAVRVLDEMENTAGLSPDVEQALARACPTWSDPLCQVGDVSAAAVICDLARFAAALGAELCVEAEGAAP